MLATKHQVFSKHFPSWEKPFLNESVVIHISHQKSITTEWFFTCLWLLSLNQSYSIRYRQEEMYNSYTFFFFFFLSHGTCAEAAAVPVSAQEWMWLHEEMLGGALVAVLHIILCQLNQDSQKFGRSLCWRILFGSKPLWATIPNPLHGVTEYTQSSEHLQVWMELSESTTAVSLGDQQLTDNYASIRNHAMKQ